jgi:hypothetical protein
VDADLNKKKKREALTRMRKSILNKKYIKKATTLKKKKA